MDSCLCNDENRLEVEACVFHGDNTPLRLCQPHPEPRVDVVCSIGCVLWSYDRNVLLTISLESFGRTNPSFEKKIKSLEQAPEAQKLPFASYLLLPMQRITRLPLLLKVSFV